MAGAVGLGAIIGRGAGACRGENFGMDEASLFNSIMIHWIWMTRQPTFNQCWHNKAMLKEFALCMSTCIDKLYTTYILQRCLQITGWSLGKKLERFS